MEGMIGEIRMFAGTFAPKNWAYCQGQTIQIASNTALFSILGTTYGGNGTTNFLLPNLASRAAIGQGQGPGLSAYALGQTGGTETVTLTVQQLPLHVHGGVGTYTPQGSATAKDESNPTDYYYGNSSNLSDLYTDNVNSVMAPVNVSLTVGPTGGNQPHNNMQPFLGMNYVLCMYGIFPARN